MRSSSKSWGWEAPLIAAGVVALLGLVMLELYFRSKSDRPVMMGTVVGVKSAETDAGSFVRVLAALPGGQTVVVEGLPLREFQKGATVLVQEYESPLFGLKSYRLAPGNVESAQD